jgi:DNA-directed RNA polymerase specialized sigma24 family protein
LFLRERPATAEVTHRIKDAVSALPPGQRRAAEAYYLTGLTQAETAPRSTAAVTGTSAPEHLRQGLMGGSRRTL